jgi:periplasmic copper chaperone A
MRPVEELVVTLGEPTVLKPGGPHIMLMGLKRPLTRGDSFPMTITFAKAPPVTVTVTVQAAGAAGPGAHSHWEMEEFFFLKKEPKNF